MCGRMFGTKEITEIPKETYKGPPGWQFGTMMVGGSTPNEDTVGNLAEKKHAPFLYMLDC